MIEKNRDAREDEWEVRLYLQQAGGPERLFTVLDSCGNPLYDLQGEYTPLGCRYRLCGKDGVSLARVTGVFLPTSFQYSVSAGGRRMRLTVKPRAVHRPVRIKGVPWRFRGSILTRSFDLVEGREEHGRPRVVMTHGRCWNARGDCYAVEIFLEGDVPLALCAAVALDASIVGGSAVPVPAGGSI